MLHGFGPLELGVLALLALLLFGSQLPKMARNLGKGMRGFKDGLNEVREQINAPVPPAAAPPPAPALPGPPAGSAEKNAETTPKPQ